MLRPLDPLAIGRFKREFRSVVGISHPNLVKLYEFFFDEMLNSWYFTMEMIEGVDLLKSVRQPARPNEERLRETLSQLARGISALHRAGVLHRDLKPSNVLVTSQGRVVVLDFGLARELATSARPGSMTLAGTPHYLAPELITGEPSSFSSDWYSFGVILHQTLCGRSPYDGSVLDVLSQKREKKSIRVEIEGAPEDMRLLCARLLECDPANRPLEEEILRVIAGETHIVVAKRPPGSDAHFIGREKQLQALDEAYRFTEWGRGVTVHVHGTSGIGKTALVSQFLDRSRRENSECVVLTGKCYESESVPYKAVDELVERLGRYLKSLGAAGIDRILPRHFASLARLFPCLEPLTPFLTTRSEPTEMPDSSEFRRRAFGAMRELLARIADWRPVILFIDDLQWGDLDSVALLSEVMSGSESPALLLVVSYRAEEIASSPSVQGLRNSFTNQEMREIAVGPLEEHDAYQLSRLLIGESAGREESALEIARKADRTPFLIEHMAWHVRSKGASGHIEVNAVLRERIACLDHQPRRFLELLAVGGAPLFVTIIGRACDLAEELLPSKSVLLAERLIRTCGPAGDTFDLYHDGLRKAVLDGVPESAQREYHERLAIALEENNGDSEAIARHFLKGGRIAHALRYSEIAAEEAASVLAFDRAARLYRVVLKLGITEPSRDREIRRRLGDALTNAGRGAAAAEAYLGAVVGADPAEALRLRCRAATELLRAGEVKDGVTLLRDLLRETKMSYPKTIPAALAGRTLARVRLAVLRFFSVLVPPRLLSSGETARLEVCWAAAVGTSMVNPVNTGVFCARHLRLALVSGEPGRLALAYSAEATQRAHIDDGKQKRAKEFLGLAESYAAGVADPHAKAFVLAMRAVVDSLSGRWRECVAKAGEAISIFRERCRGVEWELTTATTFLFSSRFILGRWRENKAELPGMIQAARQRGDVYAVVNLHVLACSYALELIVDEPERGVCEMATAVASWPNDRPDVQRLYAFYAEVETALYVKDADAAWRLVDASWTRFWRAGLLRLTLARSFGVSMRGRAALAAACSRRSDSAEQKRLLGIARRCARQLEGLCVPYAAAFGKLLRAGIAVSTGDKENAASNLRAAEPIFEGAGMAPWLAATRLRLASLSPEDETECLAEAAKQWFRQERVARGEGIADMFCPGNWPSINCGS